MYQITQRDVEECLQKSLPDLAEHLRRKAAVNDGFSDNPRCIHPLTRLLTLSLDQATRAVLEQEVCSLAHEKYKVSREDACEQLDFIKWCYRSATEDAMYQAWGDESLSVWNLLDTQCYRDGALFLSEAAGLFTDVTRRPSTSLRI